MKIGSIWFDKGFKFKDGNISKTGKYFIVVGNKPKTNIHLVCKTTSNDNNPYNEKEAGCGAPEKDYYFLFGDEDFFEKDTWIQFHTDGLVEYEIGDKKTHLLSKGQLNKNTLHPLLECISKSKTIPEEYLDIIKKNLEEIKSPDSKPDITKLANKFKTRR